MVKIFRVGALFLLLPSPLFAAPVITNLAVTAMTSNSVTIQWTTDVATTTQLLYGVGNLTSATPTNSMLATSHTVTLQGAYPGVTWWYAGFSRDGSGNSATSATQQFQLCNSSNNGNVKLNGALNDYHEYGSYTIKWNNTSGQSVSPTICGSALQTTYSGTLGSAPSISIDIPNGLQIVPSPSNWSIRVTGIKGSISQLSTNFTTTQTSNNISSALQSAALALNQKQSSRSPAPKMAQLVIPAGMDGSGTVNPGSQYQKAFYPDSGTNSVVGGAQNSYILPPGLTTSEINAVLSDELPGSYEIQNGDAHTPFANPANLKINDERTDIPAEKSSVKEWGAQCDLRNVFGTLVSGSTTVTILNGYGALFTSADIGATLVAVGSVDGVATAFEPTITAILDANDATMSYESPFTMSTAQQMDLGHDDTGSASGSGGTGLAGALNAAAQFNPQYSLTIPVGNCLTHTQAIPPQTLVGLSRFQSQITGFPGEDIFQNTGAQYATIRDLDLNVDGRIDPTKPWNIVNAAGTTIAQTQLYRPIAVLSAYANNPLGPGWLQGPNSNLSGSINGVGTVMLNSPSMTVLSAALPTVGETLVFPYTSMGLFTATVSSIIGSSVTLGANFPGASTTQEEWFAGASVQNIQTAIPATSRAFPMTITLANSISPTPVSESNVAPYGLVEIDGEQFTYIGYSKISPYSITLQAGAQNGTTAAAHSVGAAIVPLNPFEPQYPWPVTPTINSGDTTPTQASFYPAWNIGNVAFAFPMANGAVGSVPYAWYGSLVDNLFIQNWPYSQINGVTFPINNGGFYFVGLPYSTRFTNIDLSQMEYGIAEGAASINNHDYWSTTPTSDGTKWDGVSIRSLPSGFATEFIDGNQNSYKDFNMYTEGGAAFNLSYGYDDQTGGAVSTTFRAALTNLYTEPGSIGYPGTSEVESTWGPLFELDCSTCTWDDLTVAGDGEIYLSGTDQEFESGYFRVNSAAPVINYGTRTQIRMQSATVFPIGNVYGTNGFLNWGPLTSNSSNGVVFGSPSGPNTIAAAGNTGQPAAGQTNETFNTGNTAAPYANSQTGYISAVEFNADGLFEAEPMNVGWTFDDTAPISHSYVACDVATSPGYTYCNTSAFNQQGIFIGPDQRLTDGEYDVNMALKESSGSTQTWSLYMQATACGAEGFSLINYSVPISTIWTNQDLGVVDLSPYSGCKLDLWLNNTSTADAQVQIAYLDFAPVPANQRVQNLTVLGTCTGCSGMGKTLCTGATTSGCVVANITVTLPTSAIGANTCTTAATKTMTGVTTASTFTTAFVTNPAGVTGWGATSGLVFEAWPTANTLNWSVCNQTSSSITPGAITLNVSAK